MKRNEPQPTRHDTHSVHVVDAGDILIVDDEHEVATLVHDILLDEGYPVRIAPGGREALAAVEQQPPALMLLDLLMPHTDGYDVLRELQTRQRRPRKIIIFSANQFDEQTVLAAGATDILRKPFLLDELLECIQRHFPNSAGRPGISHA